MSGWHRDHPELTGTDADPWMANPAHAAAHAEVQGMDAMRRAGYSSIEEAEAAHAFVCTDEDCREVQPWSGDSHESFHGEPRADRCRCSPFASVKREHYPECAMRNGACRECGAPLVEREP